MKKLASYIISTSLLLQPSFSLARQKSSQNLDNGQAAMDFTLNLLKSGTVTGFLKELQSLLTPTDYQFLKNKASQIHQKEFKATRVGNNRLHLWIQNSLVSFEIVNPDKNLFIINNRNFSASLQSIEKTWKEIEMILSKAKPSYGLINLWLPSSHASVGAVVGLAALLFVGSVFAFGTRTKQRCNQLQKLNQEMPNECAPNATTCLKRLEELTRSFFFNFGKKGCQPRLMNKVKKKLSTLGLNLSEQDYQKLPADIREKFKSLRQSQTPTTNAPTK